MELLEKLSKLNTLVENALGIVLKDEDFADGRDEIEHIFFHEVCHAAVAHCVPWILRLDADEHTALDELLARLLEMSIGRLHGLAGHSPDALFRETKRYSVAIDQESFEHFLAVWEGFFWPRQDLAGMAGYLLTWLRFRRVVYHILPAEDWDKAQLEGVYIPESLVKEGFIHCSNIDQVLRTANAFFIGEADLFLLCIAAEKTWAEILEEDLAGEGIVFPHIYGPLNLEAVVCAKPLTADEDGTFVMPFAIFPPVDDA